MAVRDVSNSQDASDRLEHEADTLKILQLEAEYAHLFDTGQGEAWAALFTPDAVFFVDAVGDRPPVEMRGHDVLMQRCNDVYAREVGLHFPMSPQLTMDGRSAQGLVQFRFHAVERATGNIRESEGFYEVQYRKDDEQWLITVRHEHPVRRGTRRQP